MFRKHLIVVKFIAFHDEFLKCCTMGQRDKLNLIKELKDIQVVVPVAVA